MKRLRLFQVDAFADEVFHGNPAAVCPLDRWLEDRQMQSIAEENNLAETAFFVPRGDAYDLRWFTPRFEVNLCGHATLASAFIIFNVLEQAQKIVRFETRSGTLEVARDGDRLVMDFPALPPRPCTDPPEALLAGLGMPPSEVLWAADDYFAVYDSEEAVRALRPNLQRLEELQSRGAVATGPSTEVDFVSRYFAPAYGIPEDPVTGSTHCTLVPFWAHRLGKTRLHARQVSKRGGDLFCEAGETRVSIAGRAVLYLEGYISA
jgi:PhzF family phenazine biosynthesis protein